MRTLRQPGPEHPTRIDMVRGHARELRYRLQPGLTLNQAVSAPLVEAGFQAAVVRIGDACLAPFSFVMPGPPDGPAHVAYFTAAVTPPGQTRLLQAGCTFGFNGDTPAIHCHAAWTEADGRRRGGHILPQETWLTAPAEAVAWGFPDARIATAPDAETNFVLFQVSPATGAGQGGPAILARVKPNQDIVPAIETIAAANDLSDAVIRGSLGSLIGVRFADGSSVDDFATEVLVEHGSVRDGRAELDLLVIDMQGAVHRGRLARTGNPVLITFDLVLTPA